MLNYAKISPDGVVVREIDEKTSVRWKGLLVMTGA